VISDLTGVPPAGRPGRLRRQEVTMVALAQTRTAALVILFALAAASAAPAQVPPSADSIEKAGDAEDSVRRAVARARTVAITKLLSPKCGRLFVEFQDLTVALSRTFSPPAKKHPSSTSGAWPSATGE
jgi:hypothetical protein